MPKFAKNLTVFIVVNPHGQPQESVAPESITATPSFERTSPLIQSSAALFRYAGFHIVASNRMFAGILMIACLALPAFGAEDKSIAGIETYGLHSVAQETILDAAGLQIGGPHAVMVFELVGRIAGLSDPEIFKAWDAGQREQVIARALRSQSTDPASGSK